MDSYAGFTGYVWTEAEKVEDSKISGYVWTRPMVNRDGWPMVDLTLSQPKVAKVKFEENLKFYFGKKL